MPAAPAPLLPSLFAERQDFWRPWWWLALLVPAVISAALLLSMHRYPAPLGVKWLILIVPTLLTVGVFALLRLETHLDAEGISYRFYPLGWRRLAWAEIRSAQVRQYSPVGEYGGWGYRRASATSHAYNVAGDYGLQLELNSGHRILLGTQQPEALGQALAQVQAKLAG
jgi:hypothetical protein